MGTFRVEVQATGNHGCMREVKDGGMVNGCRQPGCVDCITRDYLDKLTAAGAFFSSSSDPNQDGHARLTHWPGQSSQVKDDLLTGIRSGSF